MTVSTVKEEMPNILYAGTLAFYSWLSELQLVFSVVCNVYAFLYLHRSVSVHAISLNHFVAPPSDRKPCGVHLYIYIQAPYLF